MQDQVTQMWRQFQAQAPIVQGLLLLTPFLAAAVVVLAAVLLTGPRRVASSAGSTVATAAAPLGTPTPTSPRANEAVLIVTSAPAGAPTPVPATAAPAPVVPIVVATLAPTAVPSPTPEPTSDTIPSRVFRVVNTEGQGASLRREPRPDAQRIKVILERREVEALGPTTVTDGRTWRRVRDEQNDTGWISDQFLENIRVDPRITATPLPLTLQVVDLTAAPARGEEATVTIRTRSGTRCELRVFIYGPATLPREGLQPTTANDEGLCSWTWTVPPEAVPGTWRYWVAAGVGDRQISREIIFSIR